VAFTKHIFTVYATYTLPGVKRALHKALNNTVKNYCNTIATALQHHSNNTVTLLQRHCNITAAKVQHHCNTTETPL
jgi:hypothetical protein